MNIFRTLHKMVNKPGVSANTMVCLTSTGQRAVYTQNIEASMNFRILKELDGHGGMMSVTQIVRSPNVRANNPDDVKNGLNELKNAGYIRFQTDNQMMEQEE